MEPPSQADLVCLYLAAVETDAGTADGSDEHQGGGPSSPAPEVGPRTVRGIGAALELDRETTPQQIGLLSTLEDLEEEGLATTEAVTDAGTTRTVVGLTGAGRRHARRLRERLAGQRVTVTDGTTEEVAIGELDRYFEAYPLVRALTRVTDDGEIRLWEEVGGEFVDREAELERLRETLSAVPGQGSRTVLVSGEAGVGKTTLVERLLAEAREEGFRVATGRCRRTGDRPYGPVLSAFRDLPEGNVLVDPVETAAAVEAGDPGTYEERRDALFSDVADAVRERAREHPLVLFLDDLQWAGTDTRELFAYLSGTVTEWVYPALFVATYRSEDAAADEAFDAVARETAARDRTEHLDLGPLPDADSHGLVAWLTGRPDPPASFLEAVRERTGGNPLLLRETVQGLLDAGVVDPGEPGGEGVPADPGEIPLPDGVAAVVETRLATLPGDTRGVLEAAAVAGDAVAPEVVAAVLDEPEASVNDHLDALATGRFLDRTGSTVTFVGGLVREAIVDGLDDECRRELHARVAEALRTVYPGEVEKRAARIAHHYDRAGATAAATDWYRRAGEYAERSYATDEAVESYERAVSLARERDDVDPETLVALLADLAEVQRTTGAFDRARETAREGLAAGTGASPETCRLLDVRAHVLTEQSEFEAATSAARRLRETATAIGDGEFETKALSHLGSIRRRTGDLDEAADHLRAGLQRARERSDGEMEANLVTELGSVAWRQGEHERAREHYETALALARETDRPSIESACLNNLGGLASDRSQYERARGYYERRLAIAGKIGDPHQRAITLGNLGYVAAMQGRYGEAREYYERELELTREMGDRMRQVWSLTLRAGVDLRVGDLDEARESLEEGLDLARSIGNPTTRIDALRKLAAVARLEGEYGRASDRLDEALALLEGMGNSTFVAQVDLERGRLALERDDLEAARERVEEAREAAAAIDATHWVARCRLLGGRIAAADGRDERARERWRTALSTFEEVGAPQDALTALRHLVDHCIEHGDRERAAEYHEPARDLLADAPEATAENHREWVEDRAGRLDGE